MAKAMVPIIALDYREQFDLEAFDVFEELGVNGDDEFTFTMRVSLGDPVRRDRTRREIRKRLPADQSQRLIEFLDDNEWDVSFLVDCY